MPLAGGQVLEGSAIVQAGAQLEGPSDLTGYVVFDEDATSLLAKYLSVETWQKYAGKKDTSGISFERQIFQGCSDPSHPIGVVASCRDSYYSFRDLYDAIINEYQRFGLIYEHQDNMNLGKLSCPQYNERQYVSQTTLSIDRNVRGVVSRSYMSPQDKMEVERQVLAGIELMLGRRDSLLLPHSIVDDREEGQPHGNYYCLYGMEAWDGRLWRDFRTVKENLKAFFDESPFSLGFSQELGSGFYHGELDEGVPNLLLWVNGTKEPLSDEEESVLPHVRVVAIEHGQDIKAAATRLATASMLLDAEIDFDYDDRLGFITASPTMLGTALKIEVQLKTPYVLGEEGEGSHFEIEEKYDVHFSQEEIDERLVTFVTNTKTLGPSAVQLC